MKQIELSFKKWRVLEKKDIDSLYQVLWNGTRGEECPGVAVGHYDGSNEKGYAVLIIPKDSTKRQFKLLFFKRSSSGNYTVITLIRSNAIGDYPVIYKGKPGVYTEVDSFDPDNNNKVDSIKTKHEVIICEFLEKGALAYYYRDGKFHELVISD